MAYTLAITAPVENEIVSDWIYRVTGTVSSDEPGFDLTDPRWSVVAIQLAGPDIGLPVLDRATGAWYNDQRMGPPPLVGLTEYGLYWDYGEVGETLYASDLVNFTNLGYTMPALALARDTSALLGQHLKNTVRVTGRFYLGAAATFGDEAAACAVTIVDDTNLTIVTPLCDAERHTVLTVTPANGAAPTALPVIVSGAGYRLLRGLLPRGRYLTDPANPFNVVLAAIGHQLDLIQDQFDALTAAELFPDLAETALYRWERIFGLPVREDDTLAARRARLQMMMRLDPLISTTYLNSLAQTVLPGLTMTENDPYTTYGRQKWQYQILEPSPNWLDSQTWAQLQQTLQTAGPGFALACVGHSGFIVGSSRVGRDFLDAEP
ncbi:putative phage tail protein [Zavarzinia sp.]|uniref:putative phage tail protein n=1 Tax=Zavarzinia sp. TaxID=2027920 RepID=UPI0035630C23